jgi:hypothetical protein
MKKEEKKKLLSELKKDYEKTLFLLEVEERILQRILIGGQNPAQLGSVQKNIGELKVRLETIEDIEKELQ